GHILEPTLDLGEVRRRAPRLTRDLAQSPPLAFAVAAQNCAQLAPDLISGYAQSRTHNAQSISPHGGPEHAERGFGGSRLSLRPDGDAPFRQRRPHGGEPAHRHGYHRD